VIEFSNPETLGTGISSVLQRERARSWGERKKEREGGSEEGRKGGRKRRKEGRDAGRERERGIVTCTFWNGVLDFYLLPIKSSHKLS
jgi:hypothetical protein